MNNKDKIFFETKKIQKLINGTCEAYTNRMFDDFYYHPEYKGKNFTWKKFPVMVARIASISSYIYFPDWELYSRKLKKDIEEAVYDKSLILAEEKVKTMFDF